MTNDELTELIGDCPYLYHMAMRNSWPLIQKHGLLPTDRLLDLFEVAEETQNELTSKRRPASVDISHPELGKATVRDQIPMFDKHLQRCLEGGLTPKDWHKRLNERVFFWLTSERLKRLLCAGAYRKSEHIVLKVPIAPVIEQYADRIELSPMNSGCTMPMAHPRGPDTFLPIADYPYEHWRKRRRRGERVVELTVIGGLPDIADLVEEVTVMSCGEVGEVLYHE